MKRSEIRVRDPFIVLDGGTYYLYATTGETMQSYYVSDDLEDWEYGGVSFEIPEDFWAYKDVWAGEVHKYKDRFYLFVSLLGRNGIRGTQIAAADTPRGPFIPIVPRAATPEGVSCIDGTFWVEDGRPYIVYSHDWPDNYVAQKDAYVGEIWAAELSDDLTSIVGEPRRLFASDDSPVSRATPHHIMHEGKTVIRYGSDAPFLQRLSDGRLYMTWSPYLENNYVVLSAVSDSGRLEGPWVHLAVPLYDNDGGHAMFFIDKLGRNVMSLHQPERPPFERARLYEMQERDGWLSAVREI